MGGRRPASVLPTGNTGPDGGYDVYNRNGNEQRAFAVALRNAGYRTALMGKYLNGYYPQRPPAPGYDEWDVTGLGYGEWLHGEAIGCGMVMAADLSARLGLIEPSYAAQIAREGEQAGLPVVGARLGADRYLQLMRRDKKSSAGESRFVLEAADPLPAGFARPARFGDLA